MLLINKKSLPSDAGLYLEVSLLFPFFLCHHCSQGEEITQCRNKNKSQKIKSRNTKSRNHQNEALDSQVRRMHKHKLGGPQLSGQKQFSLVFVYFYSQFYSLLLVSPTTYILASLHSHTSHISRITTLPHSLISLGNSRNHLSSLSLCFASFSRR